MKTVDGIKKKLVLMTTLTILPVLLAGLLLSLYLVHKNVSSRVAGAKRNVVASVCREFERHGKNAESDLKVLSGLPLIEEMSRAKSGGGFDAVSDLSFFRLEERLVRVLESFLEAKQTYDQARLINENGMEYIRVNLSAGRAVEIAPGQLQYKGDRYYFQEAAKTSKGGIYVSNLDLNREGGQVEKPLKPMLRFVRALFDSKGVFQGELILNFYARNLFQEVIEPAERRFGGVWFVVDQDGYFVYHNKDDSLLWGADRDLGTGVACKSEFKDGCKAFQSGQSAEIQLNGTAYTSFSDRIRLWSDPDRYLTLVHLAPNVGFYSYISEYLDLILFFMLLAVAVAWVAAYITGKGVSTPLDDLSSQVENYSQGDWEARAVEKGPKEIVSLAGNFNRMAGRLADLYMNLESQVRERTRELEEARRKASYNEAMIRTILENTIDGIAAIDETGTLLIFNKGAERIFGRKAVEVLGRNVKTLMPPHYRDNHDQYLRNYMETGTARVIGIGREVQGLHSDGRTFPLYLGVSEINFDGRRFFVANLRDVSEIRRTEDQLKESKARFEQLIQVQEDVVWLTDWEEHRVLFVNDAFESIWGYGREKLYEDPLLWTRPIHDNDRERVENAFQRLGLGEFYDQVFRLIKQDGSMVWIRDRGYPIRDENGRIVRVAGIAEDITERKLTEMIVHESEERFRSTFEQAAVGICHVSLDGEFIKVNKKLSEFWGYPADELIHLTFQEITHPDDLGKDMELVGRVLAGEIESYSLEKRYINRTGEMVWGGLTVSLARDSEGRPDYFISVVEDITARKQTEESAARLGRIIENSVNEIYVFNAETMLFGQVNHGARENLGYTLDEMKKMTPLDLKPDFTREQFMTLIRPLLDGEKDRVFFDTRHQRKDRTCYPVEVNLQMTTYDNQPAFVAIILDVTDRLEAKETLQRTRMSIDRASESIFWILPAGEVFDANDGACRRLGYSREEMVGMLMNDIDVELPYGRWADFLNAVRGRGEFRFESRHKTREGELLPVEAAVYRQEHGDKEFLLVFAQDITERKKTEKEIRRLSSVAERTSNVVIITDPEGAVQWVNDSFSELTGYSKDEIIGRRPGSMLQGPETDQKIVEFMRESFSRQEGFTTEVVNYSKSGRKYWLALDVQPIFDQNGELLNYVAIESDITARKEAEQALVRAKELAEAANRTKSEFLANMSHELRTPLNAIIGFSEILSDQVQGSLNDKQLRQVKHILDSGRHLLSLINDILDLSKVESGRVELQPGPVHLSALISAGLIMVREKAQRHGLNIKVDMEGMEDLWFSADEIRLKQILYNLLSNAAKFTPDGGEINVSAFAEDDRLTIEVADTGIGVSDEDQERIFNEFEQVESDYSRRHQGTGLGLSLTKKLVELHGGEIWVRSEGLGKGSRFGFRIPLARLSGFAKQDVERSRQDSTPDSSPAAQHPGRVLVVDDDLASRELLIGYLEEDGFEAVGAASGEEALEKAKELRPAAMTLDLLLPDMHGFEVLRELKENPQTSGIPVVVVSITDEKEKALEMGGAKFLKKPVDKSVFIDVFAR